jgi:hypothetical protein
MRAALPRQPPAQVAGGPHAGEQRGDQLGKVAGGSGARQVAGLRVVDVYALGLQEYIDALQALLAADTALLIAAERHV